MMLLFEYQGMWFFFTLYFTFLTSVSSQVIAFVFYSYHICVKMLCINQKLFINLKDQV